MLKGTGMAVAQNRSSIGQGQTKTMSKLKPIKTRADTVARARFYDPAFFSPGEIAINRALDWLEGWLDNYIITPLLGENESAMYQ